VAFSLKGYFFARPENAFTKVLNIKTKSNQGNFGSQFL